MTEVSRRVINLQEISFLSKKAQESRRCSEEHLEFVLWKNDKGIVYF